MSNLLVEILVVSFGFFFCTMGVMAPCAIFLGWGIAGVREYYCGMLKLHCKLIAFLFFPVAWTIKITTPFFVWCWKILIPIRSFLDRRFKIRKPLGNIWNVILGICLVVLLGIGYSHLSHQQHLRNPDDTTLPSFTQMSQCIHKIVTPQGSLKKEIWLLQDAKATYSRLAKGVLLGCFLSLVIGTAMGCYKGVAAFFSPTLKYLVAVPGTAALPIFFVMAGTGETMFVSMIAYGTIPVLTQAIYLSVQHDVKMEHINKAYTLGASNFEIIWNIVLPQILPRVIDSIRLQIGPAMVYLIAAEMLMGQVGFGYRLRIQQRLLHMDVVYVYVLILGFVGLLLSMGLFKLRQFLSPWFEKAVQ